MKKLYLPSLVVHMIMNLPHNVVFANTTTPMLFTLYTNTASWNDAKRACTGNTMDLIQPRTEQVHKILTEYILYWRNQSYMSVDEVWLGLYDSTYTSTSNFTWNDCVPFNISETTLSWGNGEPDEPLNDKCVGLSTSADSLHTFNCMERFLFVCQAYLDTCWFDTVMDAKITKSDHQVQTSDTSECTAKCLNYTDGQEECISATFDVNGACHLLTGREIHLFDRPDLVYSETSVTVVKRCYWDELNHDFPPVNRAFEPFPVQTCTSNSGSVNVSPTTLSAKSRVNTTIAYLHNTLTSSSSFTLSSRDMCSETVTIFPSSSCDLAIESIQMMTESFQVCPPVSSYSLVTMLTVSTTTETVTTTEVVRTTVIQQSVEYIAYTATQVVGGEFSPCSTFEPMVSLRSERNSSTFDELVLDSTTLSSSRRKRTSAYDARPSAIFVGTLAIGIIAALVVTIMLLDSGRIVQHIRKLHRRRRRRKARKLQIQQLHNSMS